MISGFAKNWGRCIGSDLFRNPQRYAPLDLVPGIVSVELPAANAAQVMVDPDNNISEITRVNNTVVVE